jgi:Family of unknown function (DUF6165)
LNHESLWPAMPTLPVSWGEVFDKLTILEIKSQRLSDLQQLLNVERERLEIERVVGDRMRFPSELDRLVRQLRLINSALWDIEDAKRACERRQCFDEAFIELARRVYIDNDRRAEIKRSINDLLGSAIIEEKSHAWR